ncbi:LacI family DNA-binding transcriptional regulator [Listeria fleischmannii]|uniref:LacI family transcriptional regulator n=2 Tax=Listeria fleischmannii TaxID=1069827 RepID=W7D9B3_9LIST|nr:LacI family DNA-binding transcriptional regulator [Listeria fleischmannii]EUJ50923.1 LacI family transcriptional regulator [Listeria fleischmannii FSL S10-1203]MBC1399461.1 LacI family transcriptional regulator [Listeria fleischmannii]MBC1419287.1 LacI family transcriptional regulator [Listeria fleischmannii]MBC1427811.1 LacI family transcriptional regulator [Listeria fleischmannii]STY46664.1 Purine nucleotide synthesis repressor [Listeria fleischmannii subsp. coloradonensis]
MVGIKDIAKKAGVSISTVSYALNGSSKVTEKTRKRILAIANDLNYVPNMAARTLKTRETKIIGAYLANYGGAFYGPLLDGLTETLRKLDYELIALSGEKSQRFLPEKMIDGAIILDATFKTEDILKYADRGHKMVVLDRELTHPNIRQVLLDNKGGATLAVDFLKEGFSGDFYVIKGPKDSFDGNIRFDTALTELARFDSEKVHVIEGDFEEASGEMAAAKIVREWKNPVSVFSLNDNMAIGMYRYLAKKDFVIGRDIRIIGFDNRDVGAYLNPRLATIDYSKYKWGAVAAEKLIKLLTHTETENEIIYTSLIRGGSVN